MWGKIFLWWLLEIGGVCSELEGYRVGYALFGRTRLGTGGDLRRVGDALSGKEGTARVVLLCFSSTIVSGQLGTE